MIDASRNPISKQVPPNHDEYLSLNLLNTLQPSATQAVAMVYRAFLEGLFSAAEGQVAVWHVVDSGPAVILHPAFAPFAPD